jgi:hypothetical protein
MRSLGRDYERRFEIRDEIHERSKDCIVGRHTAFGKARGIGGVMEDKTGPLNALLQYQTANG